MISSSYYPEGSYNDPSAPWNQEDIEERDIDVCISQTLSKNLSTSTTNYTAETWEDWDTGDEGEVVHTGGTNYTFDYSAIQEEVLKEEYTPIELIKKFSEVLMWLQGKSSCYSERETQALLVACSGWIEDETEVIVEE